MTEGQIQDAFAKWLNDRSVPFHRNRMDKKTSGTVGDPDFIICFMGHVIYVETKTPAGKLSAKQEARIEYLRGAGNRVEVCRSVEECIEAAKSILCEKTPEPPGVPLKPQKPAGANPDAKAGLFVSSLHGTPWVFRPVNGSRNDVEGVRKATPEDIATLPTA